MLVIDLTAQDLIQNRESIILPRKRMILGRIGLNGKVPTGKTKTVHGTIENPATLVHQVIGNGTTKIAGQRHRHGMPKRDGESIIEQGVSLW